MNTYICEDCETVNHCMKNGCIPKQANTNPVFESMKTILIETAKLEDEKVNESS